jgi:hypothetical protein
MIRTLALASHKHLKSTLDPTPPPSTRFCYPWAFVHVRKYVWTICALALGTFATPPNDTIGVLRLFHPHVKINTPPPFLWFPSRDKLYFKSKGICLCLDSFITSFFWWPFRHGVWAFTTLFCPTWFYKWFWPLFKVCGHIIWGHVPPLVSHFFFASWFLKLEKQSKNTCPIAINEVTYYLIACTMANQFRDTLMEHFIPH